MNAVKEHHALMLSGLALCLVAPVSLIVPVLGGIHNAGAGLVVAGLIKWWFTPKA